ncbi:hypothetical protein [Streptomyces sp. x-80]|uniref:hypothetical protein n=1 Tax=Streptomyces sp. x-80 TaxID=2789282 RepID=UPI0039805904
MAEVAGVVLVHGLYHRPEHFARVAAELRTSGAEVVVRCGSVREWRTGHSSFVGRPELITGLVCELLDDAGSPHLAGAGTTTTR